MDRRFDWIPDVADHRDRIYNAAQLTAIAVPLRVDIIGKTNPIEDQGRLGSCTGHSSTSMVEIITRSFQLSRLMAYYNGRLLSGTVAQDSGCSLRNVMKGISQFGVCQERYWPYDISKFARKPTSGAQLNAKAILPLISGYQRIVSLYDLKIALAKQQPVTFGFAVPISFVSQEMMTTAWLGLPKTNESIIGGHAVVAVGYDDTAPIPFVWVRNSWGRRWGLSGYFKMDQTWFTDTRRLADDLWTISSPKL